jgi:PAS domain S-box-containing protein
MIKGPVKKDDQRYLAVYSPIISPRTKELAGADMVLFDIAPLSAMLNAREPNDLKYMISILSFNNGDLRILFPGSDTSKGDGKELAFPAPGLTEAIKGKKDFSGVTGPVNLSDNVYLFKGMKELHWIMAVAADSEDLYGMAYRQILVTAAVIMLLVILGAAGIWRLLRPLTGMMIVRSDQLEREIEVKTAELKTELSERIKIEEALRESEQLLKNILSASPVGILRVESRICKWMNREMEKMFGFAGPEDYLNKSTRILYVSDQEYKRVGAALYNSFRTGEAGAVEAGLRRADGTEFDGYVRLSSRDSEKPVTGAVATFTDISDRKAAQRALKESEEKFRLISEQSLLAILILQDGMFKYVNQAAANLLEYPEEEILSWDSWEFLETVHPEDREFVAAQSKKKQEGAKDAVVHYMFRVKARSGAIKWVDIYSKSVAYEGMSADLITLLDRTDQKRAEQLLLQTERIKAIGEMAGGVAHNFNNLLQIVAGGAQMALTNLELGNLAKIYNNLEQILESSRLGAETVKRLQDFARIKVDNAVVQGKVFDLSRCVDQAIDMSEPWWKTKPAKDGITITLERDLEYGLMVMGRRSEIFEVVVNLIKNSVEAMSTGGSIFIGARGAQERATLTVRDSGPGIDPKYLGKVFEPFWTTKGVKGTGMGLASAYGVVRAHGGELTVKNLEHGGAEFLVILPRSKEDLKESEGGLSYDIDFTCSILIIDDVAPLLEVLKEGLTAMGQTVHIAESGKAGLEIYGHNRIDVVVCDLGMEEMNGWQVAASLAEINRKKGIKRTPFILLTGWAGQTGVSDSYRASDVDRIVEKPVIVTELLSMIREVIRDPREDEDQAGAIS